MLAGMIRRSLFISSQIKPKTQTFLNFSQITRPFSEDPNNKQLDPTTKQMRDELNSKPKEAKTMPFLFYGTAALLTFLMFYVQYLLKTPQKQQKKPAVKILGNATIGGSWSALNSEGKVVNNSEFLGNYLVFYFGFTRCPDVCPASLQKLSSAIELLKGKGIKNVKYLFISLDVNRDTPEMVTKYTSLFHPDIVPLVVREEDLTEFLKNFKLYSRKVLNENDYMLDHTTYMYLFDHQGKFVNILGANLSYDELAETIERHLKEDQES